MNTNPNQSDRIKLMESYNTNNIQLNYKTTDSFEELSDNLSSKDEKGDYRNGRWLPNEHMRFLKGCLLYGNNWKKVILINSCLF